MPEFINNYEEYTRLEKHLNLSKQLLKVSIAGKDVLSLLERTMGIKLKRSKLKDDIYRVFATITHTIKPRKSLCNNMFSSMIYYLDEVMYREVQHLDYFFIEDYCYSINKVYYNPREWIDDEDTAPSTGDDDNISDEEIIQCIAAFFENYEALLDIIKDHTAYMIKSDKLKKKLYRVISKIRTKHKAARDILRENGLKLL